MGSALAAERREADETGQKALRLLIVLSLGRSGSTFLARSIAACSDYYNAGENRFFWQSLAAKEKSLHAEEISRFFLNKAPGHRCFLDKTPVLYRLIDQIDFGPHRVEYIILRRRTKDIGESRKRLLEQLRQPRRIRMRIAKYRRDYGRRWMLPVLQRWYYPLALLGLFERRAFATAPEAASLSSEVEDFNRRVSALSPNADVVEILYEDFPDDARRLTRIGLTGAQIQSIVNSYRHRAP